MALDPVRMAAAIAPSDAAMPRVWRRAGCRAVMWPISWPSTPASSASELRFIEQAAIDVDVAAAGGEGVDGLVVDDEELEFLVGQVAGLRHALAHDVHVFLHGLVVVQTQGLDDFLVMLLDGLLFAVHACP